MTQLEMAPAVAARGSPCPHPEKRRFNTQAFAVARAQTFRAGRPIHTYECGCGHWHLSKQPTRNPNRKQPRRPVMTNTVATLADPLNDSQAAQAESVLVWSSDLPYGQIEELLFRARGGSPKAQSLASTIDGLVADLAVVIDRDAERTVKEERAAVLRAELAAKTAELSALEAELADDDPGLDEADTASADAADPESPEYAAGYATTAQIRAWLAAQGREVAVRGRISEELRQEYYAAHQGGE